MKRTTPIVVAVALLLALSVAACEDTATSTGDIAVVVPNVVGMDYGDAEAKLEQIGFTVVRVDRPGPGSLETVRSQTPRPETVAWPAGTITLVVWSSADAMSNSTTAQP